MFRRLVTFDEAKRVINEQMKLEVLGDEEIPLFEAYDRVLRENVVSALDIPPFNRSTVDGYAVKAEDTFGAEENQPAKLALIGMVSVGELPQLYVGKGEAAEL
ncbi:molybdopterin biosynthesis protein, partial [Candidatus Bathyarchaeota archaeon]